MKSKAIVCTLLMMFGLCTGAMAQKNIDRIVEELEKNENVRVSTIKRRDPDTHKLLRVSKVVKLKDEKIAKRVLAAFEKDEEYAFNSMRESHPALAYTLRYQNEGENRNYSLIIRKDYSMELTINITFTVAKEKVTMLTPLRELDVLTAEVSDNDSKKRVDVIATGNVYHNGKKLNKGTHYVDGRTIVVQ